MLYVLLGGGLEAELAPPCPALGAVCCYGRVAPVVGYAVLVGSYVGGLSDPSAGGLSVLAPFVGTGVVPSIYFGVGAIIAEAPIGRGCYADVYALGLQVLQYAEAVAYNHHQVVARHALETSGKPVRIVAEPDRQEWKADGMDLQHVRLTAVDAKGRRVLTYNDELQFEVEGDARIVAVTNGDINSEELNVANHRRLWQGSAMVILRAGTTPSKITLRTKPATFKDVITKLETK